jgi:hypothetical protein
LAQRHDRLLDPLARFLRHTHLLFGRTHPVDLLVMLEPPQQVAIEKSAVQGHADDTAVSGDVLLGLLHQLFDRNNLRRLDGRHGHRQRQRNRSAGR